MENLKMLGIMVGSVAFLSFSAYLLSLNVVKTPFVIPVPVVSTTSPVTSPIRRFFPNLLGTSTPTTTASTTATSSASSTPLTSTSTSSTTLPVSTTTSTTSTSSESVN